MLTAEQLEKIIELETNLRAEYQSKLDTKSAESESALKKVAELQATIDTQLKTITDLSGKASGPSPSSSPSAPRSASRSMI